MVIGSLLVVASAVASMTFAAPIFNLFDYDICDGCSSSESYDFVCSWFCETVEECSQEETTAAEASSSATASEGSSTSPASETSGMSQASEASTEASSMTT